MGAVSLEAIVLAKGAGIDQELDPLACSELALGVLPIDAILATPKLGLGAELVQVLELLFDRQR